MINFKYIYYEIKKRDGINETESCIQNENVLLIKPKTNSGGTWGVRNVNELKGFSKPTYLLIDQIWVNLEKFNNSYHHVDFKRQVDIVLEKIEKKLRKEKLKKLNIIK